MSISVKKMRGGRQLLASLQILPETIKKLEEISSTSSENPAVVFLDQELSIQLEKHELDHALKVLRIRDGEAVRLLDPKRQILGNGTFRIQSKNFLNHSVVINCLEKYIKPKHSILIGMPEQKTAEEIVSVLTGLGASDIVYFVAEKTQQNKIHLEKIRLRCKKKIEVSLKQSFATYAPSFHIYSSLSEAIETFSKHKKITLVSNNDFGFLDHNSLKLENMKTLDFDQNSSYLLVLGTEGGFSTEELDLLKQHNSCFMSLCKNVLRLETAASLGLAYFNSLSEI